MLPRHGTYRPITDCVDIAYAASKYFYYTSAQKKDELLKSDIILVSQSKDPSLKSGDEGGCQYAAGRPSLIW